jgi:hypothetical protein
VTPKADQHKLEGSPLVVVRIAARTPAEPVVPSMSASRIQPSGDDPNVGTRASLQNCPMRCEGKLPCSRRNVVVASMTSGNRRKCVPRPSSPEGGARGFVASCFRIRDRMNSPGVVSISIQVVFRCGFELRTRIFVHTSHSILNVSSTLRPLALRDLIGEFVTSGSGWASGMGGRPLPVAVGWHAPAMDEESMEQG